MQSLLQELKTILEHERAIYGAFVPLPHELDHTLTAEAVERNVGLTADAVQRNVGLTADAGAQCEELPGEEAKGRGKESTVRAGAKGDALSAEGGAIHLKATLSTNESEMPTRSDASHETTRRSDALAPEIGPVNGGLALKTVAGGRDRSPYERIHELISKDSPLHSLQTLGEVEAYVRDTILIPLDETRTNPVFGVGSPTADIMVIGEAPGADEDAQGEPFVGRAGQLLTKILEAVHFKREEVYIANILKSRPPNNRDPLPAEVEAHVPILYKQIALIQPKLILCVGRTSGTTLLNKQTTLAALRQNFHDLHGLPVLVTYHPAALLRNPNWKRPTWEDVQLLRKRYDEMVETAGAI